MTGKRFVRKFEENNYEDVMVTDNQKNKVLYNDEIFDMLNELYEENQQLKKTLRIIADAESTRESDNVKEILRDTLFGLDSVAGESFNAWNDYVLLNKFFKEYYDNEHWDNDKYD